MRNPSWQVHLLKVSCPKSQCFFSCKQSLNHFELPLVLTTIIKNFGSYLTISTLRTVYNFCKEDRSIEQCCTDIIMCRCLLFLRFLYFLLLSIHNNLCLFYHYQICVQYHFLTKMLQSQCLLVVQYFSPLLFDLVQVLSLTWPSKFKNRQQRWVATRNFRFHHSCNNELSFMSEMLYDLLANYDFGLGISFMFFTSLALEVEHSVRDSNLENISKCW